MSGLPTAETPRQIAVGIIGDADDELLVRAGTLLIATVVHGTNTYKDLRRLTGIPMGDIGNIGYRLRAAGIWANGRIVRYDWYDAVEAGDALRAQVGFILDAMIGTGELVKADGRYRASRIGEGSGRVEAWTEGLPPRSTLVTRRLKPRITLV